MLVDRGTEINLKSFYKTWITLDLEGRYTHFMTQRWPCPDWMIGGKGGTEINSNSALNMSHCAVCNILWIDHGLFYIWMEGFKKTHSFYDPKVAMFWPVDGSWGSQLLTCSHCTYYKKFITLHLEDGKKSRPYMCMIMMLHRFFYDNFKAV